MYICICICVFVFMYIFLGPFKGEVHQCSLARVLTSCHLSSSEDQTILTLAQVADQFPPYEL